MLVSRLTELVSVSDEMSECESRDDGDVSVSSSSTTSSSKSSKRGLRNLLAKRPFRKSSKHATSQSSNSSTSSNKLMMKTFFEHVEAIHSNIKTVKKAAKKINKLHKDVMTSVSVDKEKQISAKLQKQVTKTNTTIKDTIALLQQLKHDTTAMTKPDQTDAEEKAIAIRKKIVAACSQQLKDEATLYRQAQEEYKLEIETKMKRQIQIVDPTLSKEALDSMITSEEDVDVFLQQKVLQKKTVNSEIQTTCFKVKTKCEDLFALETSVRQLHQMFLDLALLTELQGEALENIGFHVREGVETVEVANEDIAEAIEAQKKVRRKQLLLIVIGIIIVAVLVVVSV